MGQITVNLAHRRVEHPGPGAGDRPRHETDRTRPVERQGSDRAGELSERLFNRTALSRVQMNNTDTPAAAFEITASDLSRQMSCQFGRFARWPAILACRRTGGAEALLLDD